jgi:tRNA threonylcarbamoyladenosine biosynthesis protein TsaB
VALAPSKGEGKFSYLHTEAKQPDDPLILSLDTSSKRTSMAVARGARILSLFGAELGERRSEHLWDEIEFLLKSAAVVLGDIELFAVCTGPGGFTGLRVGLAAIKGFAAAGARSAVGVTSLEALAFSVREEGTALALVSGYKESYYYQVFECAESGLPYVRCEPSLAAINEIVESVIGIEGLILIGEGAEKVMESARDLGQESAGERRAGVLIESWSIRAQPEFLADSIARAAHLRFLSGEAVEPASLHACMSAPQMQK